MNTALKWFKSGFSDDEGGECVEVAYDWRKSSHSTEQGGDCLEVVSCPHAVHIRDSKNPTGPTLTLDPTSWAAFTTFAAH
ncbi:DUF397 domain-containing protein [Streptomyces sp. NPDC102274]|uniref:DUF397 domain-containing protein n=1 Tax=Streptomyces sp. NPDC102274 TaxID=3366151 RepID=UPI00383024BD